MKKVVVTVFFFRKKAVPAERPRELPAIRFNTDTARKYEVSPEEVAFIYALEDALKAANKYTAVCITRMANGALSVSSGRAYLGKVHLQGRTTWMQYMASTYNAKEVEDATLDEYIRLLKYWVKIA